MADRIRHGAANRATPDNGTPVARRGRKAMARGARLPKGHEASSPGRSSPRPPPSRRSVASRPPPQSAPGGAGRAPLRARAGRHRPGDRTTDDATRWRRCASVSCTRPEPRPPGSRSHSGADPAQPHAESSGSAPNHPRPRLRRPRDTCADRRRGAAPNATVKGKSPARPARPGHRRSRRRSRRLQGRRHDPQHRERRALELQLRLDQVSDGTHTLTATAYDAAGNSRSALDAAYRRERRAPAPAPTPEPTPTPARPSPTGMIVGLDSGSYGTSGAADVRGAVKTVRFDTERGVRRLKTSRKPG